MSAPHGADLDALCERAGIVTRYRDFWHNEHAAPEETKRALLAAMGVAADGSPSRADANAHPIVLRTPTAPTLAVDLEGHAPAGEVRWTIVQESGARTGGRCVAQDHDAAPRVECRDLPALPAGYHRLTLQDGARTLCSRDIVVCPPRCRTVADLGAGVRLFGPAVQLYALRSRRNWGIGDFTDLATLAQVAAREGAGIVGLNPLHQLFVDRPEQPSPYSPSSRRAVNPLYIDVEGCADFAECAAVREEVAGSAFQQRLRDLRARPLVDYAGVAAAKLPLLRRLWAHFRDAHLARDTPRARAFRNYREETRDLVLPAALFDALQATLARADSSVWGWPAWPQEYQACEDPAVARFGETHRDEVDFFLYLQWQADVQLACAQAAARASGMPVGLYRDLAVGANPGGAETWQEPQRFALDVHVGAPPDEFNQKGQDWGLPPWIPTRLPAAAYEPWVRLLRANMRHAGGLRIDHVMALMRLFWIPAGALPTEGTYVRYPIDDLLAILALESERCGCVVVGEDLGTVPDEVRDALRRNGVHSYRVVYFEHRDDGSLCRPGDYPAQALVTVSTHDLPTLQGFWQGTDLAARDALALFPDQRVREQQYAARAAERPRLLQALADAGLGNVPESPPDSLSFAQVEAVHRYIARAPSTLMTLQLEDVFGEREQVNLPATTDDQYPNWRRKITVDLEDWAADGRFATLCRAIRAEGRGIEVAVPVATRP